MVLERAQSRRTRTVICGRKIKSHHEEKSRHNPSFGSGSISFSPLVFDNSAGLSSLSLTFLYLSVQGLGFFNGGHLLFHSRASLKANGTARRVSRLKVSSLNFQLLVQRNADLLCNYCAHFSFVVFMETASEASAVCVGISQLAFLVPVWCATSFIIPAKPTHHNPRCFYQHQAVYSKALVFSPYSAFKGKFIFHRDTEAFHL